MLLCLDDPDVGSLLFDTPSRLLTATDGPGLRAALREIEVWTTSGNYAAGYIAYEAGYALEPALAALNDPAGGCLLKMGLFEAPKKGAPFPQGAREDPGALEDWGAEMSLPAAAWDEARYAQAFAKARSWIEAGDIYQVNLTFPLDFSVYGSPRALYRRLTAGQPVAHGGYLEEGEEAILSLSPELFFTLKEGEIVTRPMKGTAARGATPEADAAAKAALLADEKQRAENLMIVDLLRNDLSRLAQPGSVEASLYAIQTYPTLHQMVSEVRARLEQAPTPEALLRALFPCGSITGAPKIRAMEIIHALEPRPRGLYTGSLGYFGPRGEACFNVSIRTLTLAQRRENEWQATCPVGSGVVYDSRPDAEYAECLLKGRFLEAGYGDPTKEQGFELIETFGYDANAPGAETDRTLTCHLQRMGLSATALGFAWSPATHRTEIEATLAGLAAHHPWRVRVTLARDGTLTITPTPLGEPLTSLPFALAEERVWSKNPWLAHKTTRRALYGRALERAKSRWPEAREVVFLNEKGHLTEGSWTTLFVERQGKLLTPPLKAGLLPGILRTRLLTQGKATIAPLTPEDLATSDRIWLGNALRGLLPAPWLEKQDGQPARVAE